VDIGTVFKWNNFASNIRGNPKPRWFIYLGETIVKNINGEIIQTIVHICTTTTQLQYYEQGGKRSKHKKHIFQKENTPFEDKCVLDCEMPIHSEDKALIESKIESKEIEIKDKLGVIQMKLIYQKYNQTHKIPLKIMEDIYNCFQSFGIADIEQPQQ